MSSKLKVSVDSLLKQELPLKFYTNAKILFDATIGINAPTEKRLLIYFAVLRQSYERREIAEVVWPTLLLQFLFSHPGSSPTLLALVLGLATLPIR